MDYPHTNPNLSGGKGRQSGNYRLLVSIQVEEYSLVPPRDNHQIYPNVDAVIFRVNGMAVEFETGSSTPPSTAVIESIAEYKELDPLDLDQPLAEVIDTDALDSIVGGGVGQPLSDISVEFSYDGCRVHVSSDGSVEVTSS